MNAPVSGQLARAARDLEAARVLAREGFSGQAVSRAYFAAFLAAEAALLALGETRSKHSGVLSAFGRLVVSEGGFDESTGRLLRSLFERRNVADYAGVEVEPEQAGAAIADAERFVGEVDSWLDARHE